MTTDATKPSSDTAHLSVLDSDIETLVNHHHSFSWEEFEAQSALLDQTVDKLQEEVRHASRLAMIAKWGTIALGTAASFTGAHLLLRRNAAGQSEAEAAVINTAKEKMSEFETLSNLREGVALLPVSKPLVEGVHYPLPGENGSEGYMKNFLETLKELPDKVFFKRINKVMKEGETLAPCCTQPMVACCVTPYYKGTVSQGLAAALKGVMDILPDQAAVRPAVQANRQLVAAGGLSAVMGAVGWVGNKIETTIVGKRKGRLEELYERQKVVNGLKAHWQRDMMPDSPSMQHMR